MTRRFSLALRTAALTFCPLPLPLASSAPLEKPAPPTLNDLKATPQDQAKALHEAALEQVKEKKIPEAIESLKRALVLHADFPAARYDLANLLLNVGQGEEALTQLTLLVQAHPEDPDAHYRLGLLQYRGGRLGQAIEQLGEAIKLKPDFAAARKDLGAILLNNGRMMEASQLYADAIRLNPTSANPR